jgi:hypothetical protein
VRWKEGRVVQQPVAVAVAPTSAAKAVEVAPALRVIHAVPPKQNGGGGSNGVRFKGACNARLTRATRNGDEPSREVQCGGNVRSARGAAVAAPSGRRGGLGPGGGEGGGEASAGRGPRGAGRPWGGGMVTGGDADAQRQLTMAGVAYGLGSSGPGRRRGPGVPSKRRHKRGATAGEVRWAAVGTCQHALGADVRVVGRTK